VACSSDPDAPSSTAGSGGQGATAGTGSSGGGQGGGAGTAPGGTGGGSSGSAGTGGDTGGGGSGGSSGGGSGGTGGDAGGPVTPTEASGLYTFSYGDVVLEVDSMVGGRIVTFSKAGTNLLDDGDGVNYYGSTLWIQPEGTYGIDVPGLDTMPYTASMNGATLLLSGSTDAGSGFSATKSFSVDSGLDRVDIVYTVKNDNAGPASVAAWEVTRVADTGLTFYPAPSAGTLLNAFSYTYDAVGMIAWFDPVAENLADWGKVKQDGLGWLGHAQGTLLYIRSFPDLSPGSETPNEGEVELYINPTVGYVELENTGEYVELQPGAELSYPVSWYLRTIPTDVTVASGSHPLSDFAAGVLQ
jgi:hypothetical protein